MLIALVGHVHSGWPEQNVPDVAGIQSVSTLQDWSKLAWSMLTQWPESTHKPVSIAAFQTPFEQLTAWQFCVHGSQFGCGQSSPSEAHG